MIELKNVYALALMDYQLDKIEEDSIEQNILRLQKDVDDTCEHWAKVFICKHQELFSNRNTQIEIMRYLNSQGVKQGHTGKRFSEALYKQLYIHIYGEEKTKLVK